ncbi:hypothetical protein OHS58_12815 [Amycolatopsis sp. NBC_00348]
MGFHGVDVRCGQPGVGQCLPDDALLGPATGRGQAVGGAVLVDGGALDHGEDLAAFAARVGQPLQDDDAGALGPARAVGGLGERLAAAVDAQAALAREPDEHARGRHHRHAAGQRQRALARAQRLGGQVDRDQRRGARRVQGDRRPFEAQQVRHAPGRDARRRPGPQQALEARLARADAVTLEVQAAEDADRLSAQRSRVDARVLQRFPRRRQQQALLRVHGEGFARRDPEEAGVEVARVVQEAAGAGVGRALDVGVGVVERVEVPAAVGREPRNGVAAGLEEVPQRFGAVHAAGQAQTGADDDDRVVGDRHRGDRGGDHGVHAEDFGVQVLGQRGRVRVVEHDGRGQGDAGGGDQPVAQFDGGERVEADVAESTRPADGVLATEDERGLRTDQRGEFSVPSGGVEAFEPGTQPAGDRPISDDGRFGGVDGVPRVGQPTQERARPGRGEDRSEAGPVHGRDDHGGPVTAQHAVQRGQGQVGFHGQHRAPAQPFGVGRGADNTGPGPRPPGDGERGLATVTTSLGQRVEVSTGGGGRGLPGRAPHADDGGEQHERVKRVAVEEFVEDRGTLDAGGYGLTEPCYVVVGQRGRISGCPRGVDDRVGRVLGDHGGDGVPIGDVAGHGRDTGAGQVRRGAAPAEQHEVLGAGVGEPAGDVAAERAGATGDQDGAARPPAFGIGVLNTGQTTGEGAIRAEGELVFAAVRGHQGDRAGGQVTVHFGREVEQTTPAARVFQRRRLAEAPQLRRPRIGRGVGGPGTHGTAGNAPHPRGAPGIRQGLHGDDQLLRPPGQTHDAIDGPGFGNPRGERGAIQGEFNDDAADRTGIGNSRRAIRRQVSRGTAHRHGYRAGFRSPLGNFRG